MESIQLRVSVMTPLKESIPDMLLYNYDEEYRYCFEMDQGECFSKWKPNLIATGFW